MSFDFGDLSRSVSRDTAYGPMTEQEYEERRALEVFREAQRNACDLCDWDGYRGHLVCDHVDRTEIHARGMAKVRAALSKGELS